VNGADHREKETEYLVYWMTKEGQKRRQGGVHESGGRGGAKKRGGVFRITTRA